MPPGGEQRGPRWLVAVSLEHAAESQGGPRPAAPGVWVGAAFLTRPQGTTLRSSGWKGWPEGQSVLSLPLPGLLFSTPQCQPCSLGDVSVFRGSAQASAGLDKSWLHRLTGGLGQVCRPLGASVSLP